MTVNAKSVMPRPVPVPLPPPIIRPTDLRAGEKPVEVEASGDWGEDSIACVFELS